jgi:acyl carrier protein
MEGTDAIRQFIVEEFLEEASADQLPDDYDLLVNGVIDSLGLLKLIEWLAERFDIVVDDVEIAPEDFRTVDSIGQFVARTGP